MLPIDVMQRVPRIAIALAFCVAVMCLVRSGLAAVAYIAPEWTMQMLGAPPAENLRMPYVVRVWAIRDLTIAGLVVHLRRTHLRTLLVACVVVDATDVLSAALAYASGAYDSATAVGLVMTAVAALVPELAALGILARRATNVIE